MNVPHGENEEYYTHPGVSPIPPPPAFMAAQNPVVPPAFPAPQTPPAPQQYQPAPVAPPTVNLFTPPAVVPQPDSPDFIRARNIISEIAQSYSQKVVGQRRLMTTLLIGLLTGGHILLESVPGLAKTTAAKTLAETVNANFRRIQCTPDLLPSDIIGTQVYDSKTGSFETRLGPVHANFVLLDEINRSSAKTQSAMLEAMQEKQTTIGGEIHPLPNPFLVIATQNPIEQEGTYELPEAQLDRFLLKEKLDYPTHEEERSILKRVESGILEASHHEKPVAEVADILFLQSVTDKVFMAESLYDYIVAIVQTTRNTTALNHGKYITYGASPRAAIGFMKSAKALALLSGRQEVIPEDIKELGTVILRHRIGISYEAETKGITVEDVIAEILSVVTVP